MAGVSIDTYSGQTLSLSLTCKDESGDPFDLTGYTARGSVRQTPQSSAVTLDLAPAIPTPANGVISISVADETTASVTPGLYYWDVVLDTPTGSVIYIAGGTAKFRQLVTRV